MPDLELDLVEDRNDHAGYLPCREGHVPHRDQGRIELVPQGHHAIVALYLLFQLKFQLPRLVLGALHLDTQRALLALNRRQGTLAYPQLLLQLLERGLIILKLYRHLFKFKILNLKF